MMAVGDVQGVKRVECVTECVHSFGFGDAPERVHRIRTFGLEQGRSRAGLGDERPDPRIGAVSTEHGSDLRVERLHVQYAVGFLVGARELVLAYLVQFIGGQ